MKSNRKTIVDTKRLTLFLLGRTLISLFCLIPAAQPFACAQSRQVDISNHLPRFSSDSTNGTNSSFSGTTYAPPSRTPSSAERDPASPSDKTTGKRSSTNPTKKEQSFTTLGVHKTFQSDGHGEGANMHFMNGSSAGFQFQNGFSAGSEFSTTTKAPNSRLNSPVEYARGADGTYRPKTDSGLALPGQKSSR
ncbi:MAG TPA: hypothetical protein V6C97_36800 [Oculatellaceae cyanobacterium]